MIGFGRYYDLVDPVSPDNGILKKGREIFLTGCCLRTATEGSGCRRLLPTEYLVVLLDEVIIYLAMLLLWVILALRNSLNEI